jgi:Tfp pilus assembly protein PilN
MIRINLARSATLPDPARPKTGTDFWVAALLLGLIGIGCWWWTTVLTDRVETILQEKSEKTQQLSKLKREWSGLQQVEQQAQALMVSLEQWKRLSQGVPNRSALFEALGRTLLDLNIWLDKIQVENERVEIHGQSFMAEDVGRWSDRLESELATHGISIMEILEHHQESGNIYSFVIQFTVRKHPVT